ncbi:MAG: glutamate--cysteine ligase, partial [Hyphomicrobiaceae bacterium]
SVPRLALDAPVRGGKALDIAREAVRLSHMGLRNRRRVNWRGQDETVYLAPLEDMVATGKTCADDLLERFHGPWKGRIEPVFSEIAF